MALVYRYVRSASQGENLNSSPGDIPSWVPPPRGGGSFYIESEDVELSELMSEWEVRI
jgi:hypothetical protein